MAAPIALFRCDASPTIGAGHVTRCMALAEALAELGWHVRFAVGRETIPTAPVLAASHFKVDVLLADTNHEPDALYEMASGHVDLLVIDHYQRNAVFERACRSFARKILVLDDAIGRNHDCDILVDAAAASTELYTQQVPAHARVLTGASYALTRQSFVFHRDMALARRDGRPVSEILVSCGATDPANATTVVIDALDEVAHDAVVTIVLSSRAPHVEAVRKRLRGNARLLLDVRNMAELMTNADLAIGAPGSTTYERAVLGLPSILVTLADNQRGIARLMVEAGAAVDAGMLDEGFAPRLRRLVAIHLADGAGRQRLAQAASMLVDGRGAVRIALGALEDGVDKDGGRVGLRLAALDDEAWLLQLQQYPQTRQHFRNAAIPNAEEHHDWMQRTLVNPKRLLLIIEADGVSVGSMRLDRLADQDHAARHEVAIALDPDRYGRGIGSAALRLVRALMPGTILDAVILPDNKASQALFEGAGFVALSGDLYRNMPPQAFS